MSVLKKGVKQCHPERSRRVTINIFNHVSTPLNRAFFVKQIFKNAQIQLHEMDMLH